MKAIIPIGGRGTRMRPVTFIANKHFIPVGNKPLIFYPIEVVVSAGIKEIGITYNPGQKEYAQQLIGHGEKWGVNITYVLQPKPVGLANIIEVCEEWVDNSKFLLHLGDNIFYGGIEKLVKYFEEAKIDGMVTMVHSQQNRRMGVPYFDKNGKLKKYVEKPKNPPHDMAVPGLYFGDQGFFRMFKGEDRIQPSSRGEYEIPDAYQWLIDHGSDIEVKEFIGKWLDPGKFDDWLETNQFLLDNETKRDVPIELEESNKIEGRVKFGVNTTVKNSTIRGPVNIGDDVVIEDSFVGPYTSIFHKCKIINCHIENSVLMEGVSLSNINKSIDSSIIGPGVEVENRNEKTMSLFLGEMSRVEL